jgi:hypothetical protein
MEIKMFNVNELPLREQKQINGGFWGALLIAAIVVVINDWDNFKNGIAGKPEVTK